MNKSKPTEISAKTSAVLVNQTVEAMALLDVDIKDHLEEVILGHVKGIKHLMIKSMLKKEESITLFLKSFKKVFDIDSIEIDIEENGNKKEVKIGEASCEEKEIEEKNIQRKKDIDFVLKNIGKTFIAKGKETNETQGGERKQAFDDYFDKLNSLISPKPISKKISDVELSRKLTDDILDTVAKTYEENNWEFCDKKLTPLAHSFAVLIKEISESSDSSEQSRKVFYTQLKKVLYRI